MRARDHRHNTPVRRRAVFLDRDGVLNHAPVVNGRPMSPAGIGDLEILRCAPTACAELKHAGYLLIVVSNQPDIARGTRSLGDVDAINNAIRLSIPIDDFRVCPHDDADRCGCRKPGPGLIIAAAHDWGIDLPSSAMVGDRWVDIEAGRAAGCRTVFIDRKYEERQPNRPDVVVRNLSEAATWILRHCVLEGA